jgi:hypothetical protein
MKTNKSKKTQKAALTRHQFLQLCTLLDPRFRKEYLREKLIATEKLAEAVSQIYLPNERVIFLLTSIRLNLKAVLLLYFGRGKKS